jgi:hypothetical protein
MSPLVSLGRAGEILNLSGGDIRRGTGTSA